MAIIIALGLYCELIKAAMLLTSRHGLTLPGSFSERLLE
jgi:hypothetical protein